MNYNSTFQFSQGDDLTLPDTFDINDSAYERPPTYEEILSIDDDEIDVFLLKSAGGEYENSQLTKNEGKLQGKSNDVAQSNEKVRKASIRENIVRNNKVYREKLVQPSTIQRSCSDIKFPHSKHGRRTDLSYNNQDNDSSHPQTLSSRQQPIQFLRVSTLELDLNNSAAASSKMHSRGNNSHSYPTNMKSQRESSKSSVNARIRIPKSSSAAMAPPSNGAATKFSQIQPHSSSRPSTASRCSINPKAFNKDNQQRIALTPAVTIAPTRISPNTRPLNRPTRPTLSNEKSKHSQSDPNLGTEQNDRLYSDSYPYGQHHYLDNRKNSNHRINSDDGPLSIPIYSDDRIYSTVPHYNNSLLQIHSRTDVSTERSIPASATSLAHYQNIFGSRNDESAIIKSTTSDMNHRNVDDQFHFNYLLESTEPAKSKPEMDPSSEENVEAEVENGHLYDAWVLRLLRVQAEIEERLRQKHRPAQRTQTSAVVTATATATAPGKIEERLWQK